MDTTNKILSLLAEHWKIICLIGAFFISGGYIIARYRTSGMRKLLNAHSEILDDLSGRLHKLRLELEKAREELSLERSKVLLSQERISVLEARVKQLEEREKELLLKIQTQ